MVQYVGPAVGVSEGRGCVLWCYPELMKANHGILGEQFIFSSRHYTLCL